MPFRSFFAALEHFEAKVCSQNHPKLRFMVPLDIQKNQWSEWFLHMIDNFGNFVAIYASYGYDFYISVTPWLQRTSQMLKTCHSDHFSQLWSTLKQKFNQQKSFWPLIFWISKKIQKSEFWEVLRLNFCFKVLQSFHKWSGWHVLSICDVFLSQRVMLI